MKPRLLAGATALLVAGPLALAAVPADASGSHPAAPSGAAGRGAALAPMRMAGPAGSAGAGAASRRATQWPVRYRTSTLVRAGNTTPGGDPSQQFASASMVQDVTGFFSADFHLSAAPTTNSDLQFGFGNVTTDSSGASTCTPDSSAYQVINTMDDGMSNGNPSYDGAHIVVKPYAWAPAKNKTWGCSYAVIYTVDSSGNVTTDDAWIGSFTDHIQKPVLSIKVANRKLSSRKFVRVPISIANSKNTIATARNTKLTWRTKGVTVRGNHNVGTIKPGQVAKGALQIKGSHSGSGSVVLTVTSGDYHRSLRLTVHPVGR